jgi:sigma-B regulation protein RsbU (phosphoserine phosphatase)
MDRQDDKYFTIWYGVFDRANRRMTYASGGHPPALLMTGTTRGTARPVELGMEDFAVGMMPGVSFAGASVALEPFSKLYVFSDGVYEVRKPGGSMMERKELMDYLASSPGPAGPDEVLRFVQRTGRSEALHDDFSLIEVDFT